MLIHAYTYIYTSVSACKLWLNPHLWHKTKSIELRIKCVYLCIYKWGLRSEQTKRKTAVIVHYRGNGNTKATSDHYLTGTRALKKAHDNREHCFNEKHDTFVLETLFSWWRTKTLKGAKGKRVHPADAANRPQRAGG